MTEQLTPSYPPATCLSAEPTPSARLPMLSAHSFDSLGCESLSFLALSVTHVFLVIQLFALGVSAVRWDP